MPPKKETKKDTRTDAEKVADSKAKFKDLFEKQVSKAINRIGLVSNLASPNYKYTDEQWRAGVTALRAAVDNVENAFLKGGKSKAGFTLPS